MFPKYVKSSCKRFGDWGRGVRFVHLAADYLCQESVSSNPVSFRSKVNIRRSNLTLVSLASVSFSRNPGDGKERAKRHKKRDGITKVESKYCVLM